MNLDSFMKLRPIIPPHPNLHSFHLCPFKPPSLSSPHLMNREPTDGEKVDKVHVFHCPSPKFYKNLQASRVSVRFRERDSRF